MRSRIGTGIAGVLFVAGILLGCAGTPAEQVAKHTKRGDEYTDKEKFKEAVIEYKNALKIAPNDGKLHYKLARAALEAKDLRTAFTELQKTVELDPANFEALGKLGEIYVAVGKTEEGGQIADNLIKSRPKDPEGFILRSGLAMRFGRIDESIGYLKKAIELDPKKPRPILTVGNLYLLKKDRKSALEWYDKALASAPGAPEVHVARGNYFFAMGDRVEGENAYRKAIELSKEKEELRIALAEQYLYQGLVDNSEKELLAVIKDLNSQRARKVLAEIKLELGKVDEAKALADAILKENDKDLDGKYLKGRVAIAEKRLDDAKALFGEVVKQDAGMGRARLYNGIVDIMKGQLEVGKKEIVEAVKLEPGNVRARIVLGDLYLKTNSPEEAEKEATEVLRRNPSNIRAAIIYGDSFLLRKDWKKAEQVYGAMVRQLPASSIGYLKMGLLRKAQDKPAEAAKYFGTALDRNPKDLTVLNEYVFSLASAGQGEKARKLLDDAISREPKNPLLWEMAGRFHLAVKEPSKAEAAYLKTVDLAPDFPRPYYALGVLYVTQKKLPDAEAKFRKVVEKEPANVGAHTLLGVVLNSRGKIEDANKEYRRTLDLAPKNPLAANNLAANLSDHGGNLDEALKFAQIAREMAPEDPNVADTLGWIYYKKGVYETAYPLIADAAKKLPKNAVVRYHHGMVLAKKGMNKASAAELKSALAIDPEFPGADEGKKTLAALR